MEASIYILSKLSLDGSDDELAFQTKIYIQMALDIRWTCSVSDVTQPWAPVEHVYGL